VVVVEVEVGEVMVDMVGVMVEGVVVVVVDG
jgi:hypothetical protein